MQGVEFIRGVEHSVWAQGVPGFRQHLVNVPRNWPQMYHGEDPVTREFIISEFATAYVQGKSLPGGLCKDGDLVEFAKTYNPSLRMVNVYYGLMVSTFNLQEGRGSFRVIPSDDLHWYGNQVHRDLR